MFIFNKIVEIGEINLYNFEDLYILIKRVDNTNLLVLNLDTVKDLKNVLETIDINYILFNKNEINYNNTEF